MNISRVWALSQIVVRAHILNWVWRPRAVRSAVRCDVFAKIAVRYFKRYLPAAAQVKEVPVIKDDDHEKIWTMWQQGEDKAPALIKSCFKSIRKHCKQELIVLDDNNFEQYVNLPREIVEKYRAGKIRRAHFALFLPLGLTRTERYRLPGKCACS